FGDERHRLGIALRDVGDADTEMSRHAPRELLVARAAGLDHPRPRATELHDVGTHGQVEHEPGVARDVPKPVGAGGGGHGVGRAKRWVETGRADRRWSARSVDSRPKIPRRAGGDTSGVRARPGHLRAPAGYSAASTCTGSTRAA